MTPRHRCSCSSLRRRRRPPRQRPRRLASVRRRRASRRRPWSTYRRPRRSRFEGAAPTPAADPLPEQRPLGEQPTRAAAAARPVVRVTLEDIGDEAEHGSVAPTTSPGRQSTPTPTPAPAAAAARAAEPAADPSPAPPRAPRSTPTPLTPATPPRSRDRSDDDRRAPAGPAPIHVRVGRVDVRAVMAPEPVAPVVRPPAPRRGPDLEEYLGSTGRPALSERVFERATRGTVLCHWCTSTGWRVADGSMVRQ